MRILFIDNHPEFTATVVAAFLVAHDVTVVPTIAGALARLSTDTFDVALVDYDLDDGKGDELVRQIKVSHPGLKLVAVSARDLGNERLVAAGADAVCAKVRFSVIEMILRELVG